MDEIIYASATTLAEAIRDKKISSQEVIEAHLQRIEAVNHHLNAAVHLTADTAREQARAADTALARGEIKGPLHGVPMTIKDSFDTSNVVTTWGTPGRARHVPTTDATAVARLKAAGAILIGKTNTPELTLSYETDNPIYGRTNNPYSLEHSPGGSSGGAAAIIAAGGSPLDLGSDTWGSIRVPAHFCGIAGIKPTSGRVPRTGHAIPPGTYQDSLTQVGPMARFVKDLALVLPLIAGIDWQDPAIAPLPLRDPEAVNLSNIHGAFFTDNGIQTPTAETISVVKVAVEALSAAGVFLEEKRPPRIEETFEIIGALLLADGGAWIRRLLERAQTDVNATSLDWALTASALSAEEFTFLIDRWDRFRASLLSCLEEYEFILSPVNAYPALLSGEALPSGDKMSAFSYTMTYNLTGWPVAVVRAGTSADGLPIGVQIAARPWREDVALAVAQHIETALGGWQRPPL